MGINKSIDYQLKSYFETYTAQPLAAGDTDAHLFCISTETGGAYVLKSQKHSLKNDYLNYTWLAGKVPVPQVVFYETTTECEMLCMTKLRGRPLADYVGRVENRELVRRYAHALKQLHSVKIDEKALVQDLTQRLSQAHANLQKGLVDTSQLQPENQAYDVWELFGKLEALRPPNVDPVFTHGDYCLDNLMFDGDVFSGLIDLDKGGIADRYQDIALAARTIQDEVDENLLPLFFNEYGLTAIDQGKIAFYILLDEFF